MMTKRDPLAVTRATIAEMRASVRVYGDTIPIKTALRIIRLCDRTLEDLDKDTADAATTTDQLPPADIAAGVTALRVEIEQWRAEAEHFANRPSSRLN
ncbi:MAG TPA: hypothetical protein VKP67_21755 [Xanthobacteraceae bacterium]|nr:hypothetical protein [Xanthobacteraceae bacterium]